LYFSTSSILKTIKSIKTILKKIITKKIMWGNIEAINDVLKKKTTKLNFQPAQYEKNKFNKDNLKKIMKKGIWENTVARQKSCGETL
jgi:predicted Zn-ribbon and HTH transcriptional regulator